MLAVEIDSAIPVKLIEIGKSGDFSRLNDSFTPSEWHRLRSDEYWFSANWFSATENLDAKDLAALIKCLTVAEHRRMAWGHGSVSSVPRLFWKLEKIDPAGAEGLVDWIVANTDNPYLPFGSFRYRDAKSTTENNRIHQRVKEWARVTREAEETQRRELTRQRKAQRATRVLFGAIKSKDIKAVAALIRKGADVRAKDAAGVSIAEHARLKGNQEIIELLRAAGADE